MKTDNPSFVLKGVEDVVYEDRPIPEGKVAYAKRDAYVLIVAADEVLVEVRRTGICGSDVHYMVEGRIGDFVVKDPMVLGHESSGVIAKVGSNVTHLKQGDKVALEPGQGCGICDLCKSSLYNLCADMKFAATPPHNGTLGRYYMLPSHLAYKLPDHLSLEEGALMEPLSVGAHSVATLGQFRANQSIVIFGCGPVGLVCMAVAKALGASRIIAVDIVPSRLDFAKEYAATDTYLPLKMNEGESKVDYSRRNAENMKNVLGIEDRGSKAVDLVVDCSGVEASIQTAFYVAKAGGTIIQVGMGNPNATINLAMLGVKELNYKGSFRYGPGDYNLSIALVAQGKIDVKPLVTHRYKFDDASAAFKATKAGKGEDGKLLIKALIAGPDCSTDFE